MKAIPPYLFHTGEPFRRRDLVGHMEYALNETLETNSRRYVYSSFVLPFGAFATGDDAEEGAMYVQPPATFGAWEITAAEFMVAKGSATSRDYTLVISDGSASKTLTNTVAAADTLTRVASAVDMQISSNTEVSFTVSGFATEALTACYAVIHIRYDRMQAYDIYSVEDNLPTWSEADDGGIVSAAFSAISSGSGVTGTLEALRIQVLGWRDPGATFAAEEDKHSIPATGSKLDSCTGYAIRDGSGSGERITAVIKDEAASTIGTVNIDPSGASATANSGNVDINDTQGNDDPTDASDDYTVEWSEVGTGDIKRAYVVLYWET